MNGYLWTLWLLVVVGITVWALGSKKRRLRKALSAAEPFREEDRAFLRDHFDLFEDIPTDIRQRLELIASALISDKNFEACGGLPAVTREMKVVIMAQAALLLVGRDHQLYPKLRTVLVYPDAFSGGREEAEEVVRLGESWDSGSVILSWRSVRKGGEDRRDGHNVVLHEFAHQLDQENRQADGFPVISNRRDIGKWAHAFSEAYETFCEELDQGRKTVMDPYGATNPAEFFAVATETFFEKARQLQRDERDLYEQLKNYYGLDPVAWRG